MDKKQLVSIINEQELSVLEYQKTIIANKGTISSNEKIITIKSNENHNHLLKIESLKYQLAELQRILFGSKSERFVSDKNDGQLTLPLDLPEITEEEAKIETEKITYTRNKQKRKHPGRVALPSHLPVEEILLEPIQNTEGLKCIGKDITDKLEYTPSVFFIKRYIRPKYVKDNEDKTSSTIIKSELPEFAIPKGIPGNSLLAHLFVSKFIDHLPFYRQIQQFKREDILITASTINNWQTQISELLSPLYDKFVWKIQKLGYIQADETPIKVLDSNKKGKTHQGYYWAYLSPLENIMIFDYQKGRGKDGPRKILENFKGYLQTDGYGVYNEFAKKEEITHLSCMAHARRYFEKALPNDKDRAETVMLKIQQLYDIERSAKIDNLSYEDRKTLRLEKSLPIMNDLGKYLYDNISEVLPKSLIGKAISYTVARWSSLMNYLYDGALEIDNNLVENSIQPIAIGRKNYLFAGSHNGAKIAAMFYSFFSTCKRNNVNPYKWLKKILDIIPEYHVNKLEDLFPDKLAETYPELLQK